MIMNRMTGPYAVVYWSLIACNIIIPQCMWSRKVRASVPALFVISLIVNMGMWLERFVIVVISLSRDYIAFDLGHVLPDEVGLDDVYRDDWFVLYVVLAVHPLPADDFDRGDAFAGAGNGRRNRSSEREPKKRWHRFFITART